MKITTVAALAALVAGCIEEPITKTANSSRKGPPVRSLDLFSCIGCHALGFERAGITSAAFCENKAWRRAVLAQH